MPTAHPLQAWPSTAALTFTTAVILSKAATQHDCHLEGKLKAGTWTPNKVEEAVHQAIVLNKSTRCEEAGSGEHKARGLFSLSASLQD